MNAREAKRLRGKTIKAVRLNTYRGGQPGYTETMHEPEIEFTDGTILRFMAEENPDGGEYGVRLIYPGRSVQEQDAR